MKSWKTRLLMGLMLVATLLIMVAGPAMAHDNDRHDFRHDRDDIFFNHDFDCCHDFDDFDDFDCCHDFDDFDDIDFGFNNFNCGHWEWNWVFDFWQWEDDCG
jgi:hypothetical protein